MTILTEAVKLLRSNGTTTEDIRAMFDTAIGDEAPLVSFPTTPPTRAVIAAKINDMVAQYADRMNDKQRNLCVGIADYCTAREPSPAQISTINNVALGIIGVKIV